MGKKRKKRNTKENYTRSKKELYRRQLSGGAETVGAVIAVVNTAASATSIDTTNTQKIQNTRQRAAICAVVVGVTAAQNQFCAHGLDGCLLYTSDAADE